MSSHPKRLLLGAAGLALLLFAAVATAGVDRHTNRAEVSGSLRVVSNWTGSEGEAFQAVVNGFKKAYPNVDVKVEQVPFDQTQAMLTQQFAAGSPPDVTVALPGIVRAFSSQGLLMNLDSLWNTWVKKGEYNKSLRAIAQGSDGHTDAVFFKGNVNALIWYKPATLKQLGIKVPQTWGQFNAALKKVKAAYGTLNVTTDVAASLSLATGDPKAAKELSDVANLGKGLIAAAAQMNDQIKPFADELLKTLQIKTNKGDVSVSFKVSEDFIKKALELIPQN